MLKLNTRKTRNKIDFHLSRLYSMETLAAAAMGNLLIGSTHNSCIMAIFDYTLLLKTEQQFILYIKIRINRSVDILRKQYSP